jgi:cation transport regulator ChaC
MNYYSYGSNMNEKRMAERGVLFRNPQKAILHGFEFVINKKSKTNPSIGFANIRRREGSDVEGVLYDVVDMSKLDRFEGFPTHYDKIIVRVETEDGVVDALTYIANQEWIQDDLKTTQAYKNNILEGKKYLSEKYYEKLKRIILVKKKSDVDFEKDD